MHRRVKHPKANQSQIARQVQMIGNDYSWTTLTSNQKKKCEQKFNVYKPSGSDKLSKYQLQRMLRQMGKDLSEEQVLQRIWQIDPKGQGFISMESFLKTIQMEKQKKYMEVTNFIGLTFDSVLTEQRQKYNDISLEEITWDFLKFYLSQNFEMDINIDCLAGKKSSSKSLNRNEFMNIFS